MVKNEACTHSENHRTGIGGILREAVFGFNDGLISTFTIIAGMYGGMVANRTTLLAALATLVGGAFSMGLGTFLGTKTERDHYESERKREIWEMKHMPEAEESEIREIYAAKGFSGDLLEKVVKKIISDDNLWLETMMREELGFAEKPPNPYQHGIVMAASFIVGALLVTIPYFFEIDRNVLFYITAGITVLALLIAGAVKTYFTKINILVSSLETLLVGAFAAGASYGVGILISS
jgi:vacuolar iron transporter family protein